MHSNIETPAKSYNVKVAILASLSNANNEKKSQAYRKSSYL